MAFFALNHYKSDFFCLSYIREVKSRLLTPILLWYNPTRATPIPPLKTQKMPTGGMGIALVGLYHSNMGVKSLDLTSLI